MATTRRSWPGDFPAVRFAEGVEDARPSDDASSGIDFDYVTDVTRVNGAALASLACAPPRLQNLSLSRAVARPGGRAALDARAGGSPPPATACSGGPPPRPTGSSRSTSRGTAASLVIRKATPDDTIYGLEAFDAAGHISPAAFALPGR